MARFRAFLDREGIQGEDRKLALGDVEIDDFRERLRRFFGFGVAMAGAILILLSLGGIFGDLARPSSVQEAHRVESHSMIGVDAHFVPRPRPESSPRPQP